MKYKVGDEVIVRSWESMEREFGLDDDGYINVPKKFVPWMKHFCGRTVTIKRCIRNEYYEIIEDIGDYYWTDGMFARKNSIAKLLGERKYEI